MHKKDNALESSQNHPHFLPWSPENCLSQNSSLVSKMLGTTGLYDPNIKKKKKREKKEAIRNYLWVVDYE